MKNVYSVGFLGLFFLAGAVSVGLQRLKERSGGTTPLWLTWFAGTTLVVWLILLVVVSVLYTRKADELRASYWSVERRPIRLVNSYFWQVWAVFALGGSLALLAALVPWRVYPTEALGSLLPTLTLLMVIAFLVSSIVLYLHEEVRIFEAAYLDFAQQLGVDDRTIEDLQKHRNFFDEPRSGLWPQAVVTHRGYRILFGGGQLRRIPCFVLCMEVPTQIAYSRVQLTREMHEEVRHRFKNIQSKIKKVNLWCFDGKIVLTVPLISRNISVDLLRDAMDVLIDVAADLRGER